MAWRKTTSPMTLSTDTNEAAGAILSGSKAALMQFVINSKTSGRNGH